MEEFKLESSRGISGESSEKISKPVGGSARIDVELALIGT